jgi:hypothetical protein
MMILPIEYDHVDGDSAERGRGFDPAEARADDHHLRTLR